MYLLLQLLRHAVVQDLLMAYDLRDSWKLQIEMLR